MKVRIDGGKIWKGGMIIILALLVLLPVAGFVAWLEPNRQYEDTVDGHLENAWTASTPEQMKVEIELAIAGTYELDMKDDDYGAWLKWFKTEGLRVGYQREQLENITVRLDDLILWHYRMMSHDEGFQELQDVYDSKFHNIKAYLKIKTYHDSGQTPGDILENAWFAKEHPFVYTCIMFHVFLLIFCAIWLVVGLSKLL